jgi:hypothetical protein
MSKTNSTATKATKTRDPRLQAILDRVRARQDRADKRAAKGHRAGMLDALAPLLGLPTTAKPLKGSPPGYSAGYFDGLSVALGLADLVKAKRAREEAEYPARAAAARVQHIAEGYVWPSGMTPEELRAVEALASAEGCTAFEIQARRRRAVRARFVPDETTALLAKCDERDIAEAFARERGAA